MTSEIRFYKETNFKETPIGKIPNDWEVTRLNDASTKIKAGGTPLTSKKEYYNGNIPFVKIEDLTNARKYLKSTLITITKIGLENSSAWLVPPKSLLFAMYGSIGAIAINEVQVATNQAILAIIPDKEKTSAEFLFYLLTYLKPHFERHAKQTTQANLTAEIVKNFRISLPDRLEQQKISEILSTIDEAIQKTNEIIAKTERLKKGLMQELLTKGIGHKEFKDTEIGRIPKEWEVVKLGDILDICQYGLSILMSEKGKYPIIRMDELVNGYVIPEITKYVDLDEETFRNFRLEKGDILFNRTNAPDLVGRTGIFLLEGDYVFASYLIRLRPKFKMFDPRFLTFYLVFSEDRLRQLATRAVHQANINATNLKKVKVPRPAKEEQQKIADIISTVDKKLELERKEKAKLERIKQGLMDLLLTGKIRVKVS
jgi:type I restriction enzyme S subunit